MCRPNFYTIEFRAKVEFLGNVRIKINQADIMSGGQAVIFLGSSENLTMTNPNTFGPEKSGLDGARDQNDIDIIDRGTSR